MVKVIKEKVDKSIWQIFAEGLKIYCFNFHKFFLYMAFPVLGQLLGLGLVFGLTYLYTTNLPNLIVNYDFFDNFATIVLGVVLIVLPGMLIWAKAFWDYIIAYGALNSMTEGVLTTGRVYDFKSHTQVITQRTAAYIALWLLFAVFTFLAVIPIFWVLGFIFFIYFILIFQVFTFEPELSPVGCFKKSLILIKGKFARTFLLMFILLMITSVILPQGVSVLFDFFKVTNILTPAFEGWISSLPLEQFYAIYEKAGVIVGPKEVAESCVWQTVLFIVLGFTLPLRSICWTLWYKNNLNLLPEVKKVTARKRVKEKEEE